MASPETVAPAGTGSVATVGDTMFWVTDGKLMLSTDGGTTEVECPNPGFQFLIVKDGLTVTWRNHRTETAILNYMGV